MTLRCDVAVVGGGLTGLLAADRLIRAGVDVVLIDTDRAPAAASTRSLGLVAMGWIDSPARLTAGLGEPVARALHEWSARAVGSLRDVALDLGVTWRSTGSLRLALDAVDRDAWHASAGLLTRWGLGGAVRILQDAELRGLAPGSGRLGGVFLQDDAVIDVSGLLTALADRFAAHGGRRLTATVTVEAGSGAPVLVSSDGSRLTAELVVAAAGVSAATLHPFFSSCVYPVRLQALRTVPGVPGDALRVPVLARHRFEAGWSTPDGAVEFVGCRWADQPEMGAGERDDEALSARVSTEQDSWLCTHFGIDVGLVQRWSGIAAYTCDGLPLVGPLPGAPRVLAAVGWSGWGLSLAPRAVDEICAGILGQPTADGHVTPRELTARRLV